MRESSQGPPIRARADNAEATTGFGCVSKWSRTNAALTTFFAARFGRLVSRHAGVVHQCSRDTLGPIRRSAAEPSRPETFVPLNHAPAARPVWPIPFARSVTSVVNLYFGWSAPLP